MDSKISFMELLDLLVVDEEHEEVVVESCNIPLSNDENSVGSIDLPEERLWRFPYDEYQIIGDTVEIDKIIFACGYINIDVSDITSTLSKETINYVTTGYAEGQNYSAEALKDAVSRLPVEIDSIAKLLINIWVPKSQNNQESMAELRPFFNYLSEFPANIDIIWGVTIDEKLKEKHAYLSLIAATNLIE